MADPEAMVAAGPTRRAPRWLLWVAGILLIGRIATGVWAARHAVETRDLVQWRPAAAAEAEAKRLKRPLLYDFTASWCGPCQQKAKEVFADPESAAYINSTFVPVRVSDEDRQGKSRAEAEALFKRHGVTAFPTLVVMAPGRSPVVMRGYAGKEGTLKALRDAVGTGTGGAVPPPKGRR